MRGFREFLDDEKSGGMQMPDPMDNVFAMADGGEAPTRVAWKDPAMEEAAANEANRRPLSTLSKPNDSPIVTRVPTVEEPGDRHTPGLAFMAAFSQNPVLMQLLQNEEQAPQRRAAAALAQEELGRKRAKESREVAEFEAKKPGFAASARSKTAYADATEQKVKFARERADPNSEVSKAVTAAVAQRYAAQAQMLAQKNPQLAKMLSDSAQRMAAGGVSADMAKENMAAIGKIAPEALTEASKAFDDEMQKQANARGWAGLNETSRHNQATEGMADAKMTHMLNKPQEHLSSQINDLDQALSNMQEIANLKKDVNTGVYVQGVANFVNKWIDSGLTSDSRKQLSAMLARVFNKETKTLAGAAVSAQEWGRISPQIPQDTDDDELFASKLAKAIQITNEILQKRREEYQQKGGAPIDQSVTAKKNVRASNKRGEVPMADTPKPSGDPKTAAARAWLQANPDDPRAEAIRKRLQAMGAL